MAPKVLVSDKLSDTAVQIFRDRGIDVDFQPDLGKDKDKLLEVIGEYDGLAIRSATKVTEKLIDAATNLKVIGRAGIGVDNVDIPAASKKGIIVMNTPFGNSITTAEHAIAMMFAVARQIPEANASTHAGKWEKIRFMGVELDRQDAGRDRLRQYRLASSATGRSGLKMKVIAYDPFLSEERAREIGVEKVELDELLARADFITLHVPLTDKTRNILERARTSPRPRRACASSTAPAAVWSTKTALAEALEVRPCRRRRASTCSPRNRPRRARCSACPTSSARRISAPRPPRRRRTWRCRWPSRCPTTC